MSFPHVKTDLIDVSHKFDFPCTVLFKKENQQPSGSFKLRGIGYLIGKNIQLVQGTKTVQVFSSSGGNAGLAAAYSSKHYGVKCTVVLPKTSKTSVRLALENLGAVVHIEGEHWGEADLYLKNEIIAKVDESVHPLYCHPFDDPMIWEGHGSMVKEIEDQLLPDQLSRIKGVVCSVGGGGLLCGVIEGLKKSKYLTNTPVVAVETTGAPTLAESIKNDKLVVLPSLKTIATSLAAPYVCRQALDNCKTHEIKSLVIPDLKSADGSVLYYDKFNEVVEPACGASISVINDNALGYDLQSNDIVIVIVCGGLVSTRDDIEMYRSMS